MELKLEHIDDITLAQICVESIRADNAPEFKDILFNLLKPDAKIVLDMGCLKFIDSSGIGALLACLKKSENAKDSFRLCNVTRQVQNLFDLVRVSRFFHVFDSCEKAISSFYKQESS
ncbi:MAG: STAS domain-containing protein [Syntrophaceae bacterium]|nr:STAS domain-containing protein [Syntrophaceae bacterium]